MERRMKKKGEPNEKPAEAVPAEGGAPAEEVKETPKQSLWKI